jgi:hypothetical protein
VPAQVDRRGDAGVPEAPPVRASRAPLRRSAASRACGAGRGTSALASQLLGRTEHAPHEHRVVDRLAAGRVEHRVLRALRRERAVCQVLGQHVAQPARHGDRPGLAVLGRADLAPSADWIASGCTPTDDRRQAPARSREREPSRSPPSGCRNDPRIPSSTVACAASDEQDDRDDDSDDERDNGDRAGVHGTPPRVAAAVAPTLLGFAALSPEPPRLAAREDGCLERDLGDHQSNRVPAHGAPGRE